MSETASWYVGECDLVMEAYDVALKEDYRFGTYGDAMLILDK